MLSCKSCLIEGSSKSELAICVWLILQMPLLAIYCKRKKLILIPLIVKVKLHARLGQCIIDVYHSLPAQASTQVLA